MRFSGRGLSAADMSCGDTSAVDIPREPHQPAASWSPEPLLPPRNGGSSCRAERPSRSLGYTSSSIESAPNLSTPRLFSREKYVIHPSRMLCDDVESFDIRLSRGSSSSGEKMVGFSHISSSSRLMQSLSPLVSYRTGSNPSPEDNSVGYAVSHADIALEDRGEGESIMQETTTRDLAHNCDAFRTYTSNTTSSAGGGRPLLELLLLRMNGTVGDLKERLAELEKGHRELQALLEFEQTRTDKLTCGVSARNNLNVSRHTRAGATATSNDVSMTSTGCRLSPLSSSLSYVEIIANPTQSLDSSQRISTGSGARATCRFFTFCN